MREPAPLISVVGRVSEVCERFGISTLRGQIESVRSMLDREGSIDIAVLGRFKAGKSSFLNALSAEPILPVGVIPVTSVITRLRYGTEKNVTVAYQNGLKQRVDFDRLAEFISESLNPKNKKSVAAVEVELPHLKSYEGLEFVDTPGLGSAFKHNTEVSLDWLPRVGAAIVAVGVDPPLSDQDLELIEQLLRFTPKIAVLLTKADLLSGEQLREVEEFVKARLQETFKRQFPIYFHSIRPELSHFRDDLKERLLTPLVQRKSIESDEIIRHKMNTLLLECGDFLRIAVEASAKSQAEREELKEQILGEKLSLDTTLDELRTLIRDWLGRTRGSYMKRLSGLQGSLLLRLQADLSSQFPGWQVNLYRFTRAYEGWMRERFGEAISELSRSEIETFYAPLKSAQIGLTRVVQSFQSRLTQNIEESLGIAVARMEFTIEVKKPDGPDISIGRAFDSHLDQLWFLIPMTIFRKPIERHFLAQLPFEVEKNISRLASQWTDRINKSILEMSSQAEQFITDQVRVLEALLLRASDPTPSIRKTLAEIEEYRHGIGSLSSSPQRRLQPGRIQQ